MGTPLTFKSKSVQHLRRLQGRRSARADLGQLVVEGGTLIREALAAGWVPIAEYLAPDATPVTAGCCEAHTLAEGVIERVATTHTPQPNLAVFEVPTPRFDLANAARVMVLDQINDPGNLGTILRSCEAAGFDAVVTTPGSVDPYSPKVIRASAGAIFNIAVVEIGLDDVAPAGLTMLGTSSHRGADFRAFEWPERLAIVMGSEAHGLADGVHIDEWLQIPHKGRAESLNVAMAATLLAFASMPTGALDSAPTGARGKAPNER